MREVQELFFDPKFEENLNKDPLLYVSITVYLIFTKMYSEMVNARTTWRCQEVIMYQSEK